MGVLSIEAGSTHEIVNGCSKSIFLPAGCNVKDKLDNKAHPQIFPAKTHPYDDEARQINSGKRLGWSHVHQRPSDVVITFVSRYKLVL